MTRRLYNRFQQAGTRWTRGVLAGQVLLCLGLIASGILLLLGGNPRAGLLLALVPLIFVPFSFARLRLHRFLEPRLSGRATIALISITGLLCDAVMVAQLLSARDSPGVWLVQAAGVIWVGAVWFSAHALFLLGWAAVMTVQLSSRPVRRALKSRHTRKRTAQGGLLPLASPPDLALPANSIGQAIRLMRREGAASPLLTNIEDSYLETGRPRPASNESAIWRAAPPEAGPTGPLLGRRELLQRAGLVGAAVPFGISLSGVPLSYDFRVETREITLPSWPTALDGLRVVHLSDIHVGGLMDRERLQQVVELSNGCDADLVLHTGDFLTHRRGDFDSPLYDALRQIQSRHGQWACLGNHDFDFVERFVRRLADSGVTALRDRVATVAVRGKSIEIAGIDFVFERWRRRAIYTEITSSWGARSATPRLLLNHDPTGFHELPEGCADLVLSGHTHGGHIGVQLGSAKAITVVGLAGWPDQGIFNRGDMRMYVTRCVGFYGYPMRLGIPPEIALLILRAPRQSALQASAT